MSNRSHDWTIALVAFIASLVVNGMLLSYSYGKIEQRVAALEHQRAEMREEWKAARERIERTITAIEKDIKEQKR